MTTSLPARKIEDSAAATRLFFDSYGTVPKEYNAVEVDAAVGFFTSKGFSKTSATSTAIVLLEQSKIESIPIFQILDSLKRLSGIELSQLVGEILNNSRDATSTLGFRVNSVSKQNLTRNISA